MHDNESLSINEGFYGTAAADELAARTRGSAPDGQVNGEVEASGDIPPNFATVAKGTQPSNTVPNNSIPDYFQALRWGVDSLYLSFPGEIYTENEYKLGELKKKAQSNLPLEQAQAQIELYGHLFEVKDRGTKFFPFILEDNAFRIQLSKSTSKSMPMAYVKVSSEYLSHKPVEDIADELRMVLDLLGEVDYMPKVSRIDLHVDFVSGFDMESWDRHAWITKAGSINQYSVNGKFSGWTVGLGGVIAARLYNKVLEIEVSGKEYLKWLWREAGWSGETDVWRLEFQLEREVLAQLGTTSLGSVLNNLNGLWSYASTEWLRLTIPNPDDKTRSRWPIHPLWGHLSAVDFDTNGGPLLRQFTPQRIPATSKLCQLGFSLVTSLMAKDGVDDLGEGGRLLVQGMLNYANSRAIYLGLSYDDFIKEQVSVKRRRFNTLLNLPEPVDISIEAEEYRRLSDGE